MSDLNLIEIPEPYKWTVRLVNPTKVVVSLRDGSDHPILTREVNIGGAYSKSGMASMVRRAATELWADWQRQIAIYGWAKELFE